MPNEKTEQIDLYEFWRRMASDNPTFTGLPVTVYAPYLYMKVHAEILSELKALRSEVQELKNASKICLKSKIMEFEEMNSAPKNVKK